MICRLGLLVVIATCVSAASALPPCVCTRELKPVCGTDGQTYNNMCLLACQQHSRPGLQLESYGRCRSVRRTSDDCICTFDYTPVCASNGRTYPNRCAMDCEGNLEIIHEGECRSKREVAAERICLCPFIYSPVCGTNGETYPSECSLKCAENVKVAHTGECRAKREVGCICPLMYAPVCGTDGKTYANECAMDCDRTGHIKVDYHGPCKVKREVEDEPPVCFCTFEHDPVCGTNGRTYANMCSLECEGGTVQVAYKGDCRAKRETIQIAKLPACVCSREAKPVCGTDGKTYSNPCLLNCIKELTEDLDIDHPGPCRKQDKVREANPEPVCSCTRNLQPVCASNGRTYNNECLMRCAGEDLTVEKYGQCDEA